MGRKPSSHRIRTGGELGMDEWIAQFCALGQWSNFPGSFTHGKNTARFLNSLKRNTVGLNNR